jgi:hypothetical protein
MLGPRRFGRLLALLAFVSILALVAAMPAAAAVRPQEWHRYNIYEPLGPSHERLRCLTNDQWRCRYDTVPEPKLGFSNPNVIGTFIGTDVTARGSAPTGSQPISATPPPGSFPVCRRSLSPARASYSA